MRDYNYYLFDADGTLFDTTELICQCFRNTARVAGKEFPGTEKVLRHIGMTLYDQMQIYFGPLTQDEYEELRKVHMDYQLSIYKEYLRLCKGVAEALQHLKSKGKKCAVVTSRLRSSLEIYLLETGILPNFDLLITPESTKSHKPSSEPALKALELLGGTPEEALFIGDSTYDIECGFAAGTDTAFVSWSHNEKSSLNVEPTYYLQDMRDLCM